MGWQTLTASPFPLWPDTLLICLLGKGKVRAPESETVLGLSNEQDPNADKGTGISYNGR